MTKNTPEIVKKLKTIRALLDVDGPFPEGNDYTMSILDPQTVSDAIISVEYHGMEVRNADILYQFADLIDDLIEQIPQAFAENERRNTAGYLK